MALGANELATLRDELVTLRARGVMTVRNGNGELVTYRSDAEMAAAITDLEARIKRASAPRPGAVLFSSSKGL